VQVTPPDALAGVGVYRVEDAHTGWPCGICVLTVKGHVADLEGRTTTADRERRVHAILSAYCWRVLGVSLR
jgi:hypothetical protein